MFDLGSIFKEIHRRSLWQVLGAYLAVAWITLQVIEVLMGTIGLPDWVPLFAIVILLIGLPVVLATAFIQRGIGRWRTGSDVGARGDASNEMGQPESDTRETSPLAEEPAHAGEQSAEPSPLRHHLFTWRNALIAGVVAFAMLGAGTGGYMLMRSLGIGPAGTLVAKGLLAERAPAVLADFTSTTGDSLLARVATEALRVDLSQSEAVRLVESSKVGEALARMQRSTDEALTLDLARELAIREGIPAAIGGEISSAGHGFVLSARLVATADGNALASHRVSAADSSEIISAIDELSKKLRERIGESLKSLQHDDPLERVTTKSLPALRRYSLAVRAIETEGDAERGIELLEEAVALDTTFAMAYRKLGVALSNRGIRRERQVAVIRKAYENRDRLTTRERYLTAGSYFMSVANDLQRAAAAYETLLELDPTEDRALNNLGVVYTQLGEHAEAERYYRRAIEADSTDLLPYGNVAIAQIAQGKFGEARATLDEAKRRSPGYLAPRLVSANLYAAQQDLEQAAAEFRATAEQRPGNPFWEASTDIGLGSLAALQGRLSEAEASYGRALSRLQAVGATSQYYFVVYNLAQLDLVVRSDTAAAIRRMDRALEALPLAALPPLDRPYLAVSGIYASAGETGRARQLLDSFERETPPELRSVQLETLRHAVLGAIAFAEGRYEEAAAQYRQGQTACEICPLPALALIHETTGRTDSVVATLEKYIEVPWAYRLTFDQFFLPLSYEWLGRLYEEQDDLQKAAENYAKFVELWVEADPELQPRVEAAQTRLEAIVRARG